MGSIGSDRRRRHPCPAWSTMLGLMVVLASCATSRTIVLISNKEDTSFYGRVLPRSPQNVKVRGPSGEATAGGSTPVLLGTGKFVEIDAGLAGSYEIEASVPKYGTRRQTLLPDPSLPSRVQFTFVEVGPPPDDPVRRLPDPPRYKPGYAHRIAAVIGISDYQHWSRLPAAHTDAKRIASRLRELGFDEVLELYDRDATRERMMNLLGTVLPARSTAEDLAVIYFAGHGDTETLKDGTPRGYIIPAEAPRGNPFSTAISMEDLRDLRTRTPAKHVLYLMDSCYSGLLLDRGRSDPPVDDPRYFEWATMRPAAQILTAGEANQEAKELGDAGLFTKSVLQALAGAADADQDGIVTFGELAAYVQGPVVRESQGTQTPRFGRMGEGNGTVVFKLR